MHFQEAFNQATEADIRTPWKRTVETVTPDYSGHPKSHLKSVEGAVSGSGRCSEDAEQEESEGLELHPCCLFSEALMDYDHMRVTLTSNLEFSRRLGPWCKTSSFTSREWSYRVRPVSMWGRESALTVAHTASKEALENLCRCAPQEAQGTDVRLISVWKFSVRCGLCLIGSA